MPQCHHAWRHRLVIGVHETPGQDFPESRLHGTGAFVEPHVAPLLVRPIRFQFLQICCLGAWMVDQPLLPTASNLGTHLVFRPFLCNATPPMFLIILKFLSQGLGLGLGLGNAANGWRYLGPPLRPAASLLVKGEGGRLRRTEPRIICIYICYVYYVVYTMLYTYYIYSITTI